MNHHNENWEFTFFNYNETKLVNVPYNKYIYFIH